MSAREKLHEQLNARRMEESVAEQIATRKRDQLARLRVERFGEAPRPIVSVEPAAESRNAGKNQPTKFGNRDDSRNAARHLKDSGAADSAAENKIGAFRREVPRAETTKDRRAESLVDPETERDRQPFRRINSSATRSVLEKKVGSSDAEPSRSTLEKASRTRQQVLSRSLKIESPPTRVIRYKREESEPGRSSSSKELPAEPFEKQFALRAPITPAASRRDDPPFQRDAEPLDSRRSLRDTCSRSDDSSTKGKQFESLLPDESAYKTRARHRPPVETETAVRRSFSSSEILSASKFIGKTEEQPGRRTAACGFSASDARARKPVKQTETQQKLLRHAIAGKIKRTVRNSRTPRATGHHHRSALFGRTTPPAGARKLPSSRLFSRASALDPAIARTTNPHASVRAQAAISAVSSAAVVPDPTFEAVATPIGLYPPPAAPLSALNTHGAFIIDPQSAAVALRGVNVTGFDDLTSMQAVAGGLQLDDVSLAVLHQLWGLNMVRIPMSARTVVSGNSALAAADLLNALESLVEKLQTVAMYSLLAIEAPAPPAPATPGPDTDTTTALQTLAARFATSPAVFYEILASSYPLDSTWPQVAQQLIGAIRSRNSAAMVFVNTGNGGLDYTQFPLLFPTGEPVFNIVYTISVGPGSAPIPEEGVLASLAENYPLCATIWSDDPSGLTPYSADLFGRYGIHWAASNWNSDPRLVANSGVHDFSATSWGLTVQRTAAYPLKPHLRPFIFADSESAPNSAA